MRIKTQFFAIGLGFLLTLVSVSFAKDVPVQPDHFFFDEALIVDATSKAELERIMAEHERLTGEQIYIAVFSSLDGEDLTRFSENIYRAWKIGQFKKNNGVLITASIREKAAKITVGFGLEHLLNSDQAADLSKELLLPEVKVGNIGPGLLITLQSILKTLGSPLAASVSIKSQEAQKNQSSSWLYLFLTFIFLGLTFLIDKIVAAEAVFSRNGWRRTPLLYWTRLKNNEMGGGASGNW